MASAAPQYRDESHDGYTYRQYANGDILILSTPKGKKNIKVTRKDNFKAWAAITGAIGTWEDYKKGLTKKRFLQGGQRIIVAVLEEFAKTQGASRPKEDLPPSAESLPVDAPLPPAGPDPAQDSIPAPILVGAVFSLGIFLYALSKRDA